MISYIIKIEAERRSNFSKNTLFSVLNALYAETKEEPSLRETKVEIILHQKNCLIGPQKFILKINL